MTSLLLKDWEAKGLNEGRISQIRRVMRPQPDGSLDYVPGPVTRFQNLGVMNDSRRSVWGARSNSRPVNAFRHGKDSIVDDIVCPYAVGDILVCKETWAPAYVFVSYEYGEASYYAWDNELNGSLCQDAHGLTLHYRADGKDSLPAEFTMPSGTEILWRSPVTMPIWASRLSIQVTEVRVERLQSISESDAMAQGAKPVLVPPDGGSAPHVEGFRDLWDSTAKVGEKFADNPWVFVFGVSKEAA